MTNKKETQLSRYFLTYFGRIKIETVSNIIKKYNYMEQINNVIATK